VRDERELIEAARAGSVPAFTELVLVYRVRLLRFLLTRCPTQADAEDAVQDTFLNAWRYLDSYDATWRFSTWLYRIALRNAARLHEPHEALDVEPGDADADPLRLCMAASERENLWLVARRVLKSDVCTALWLRYVEDMSVNDVAVVLDRSAAWTKVNLMRARQALDTALRDAAPDDGSQAYGQI
jgi:RNA polymerase sigma-70 factor (ECF subfamily)